jgi:hypothetical protein
MVGGDDDDDPLGVGGSLSRAARTALHEEAKITRPTTTSAASNEPRVFAVGVARVTAVNPIGLMRAGGSSSLVS